MSSNVPARPQRAQAGGTDEHPHGPGLPGRVRLRRQLRRLPIFDISNPKSPEDRRAGAVPRLPERHLGLRQPALPVHRLLAQRQLLQQRRAARDREGVVGGHEGLRHQRQGEPEVRQPPSRPTAARTPTRWCPARTATNVYLYVSSYSPSATFPDCQPPHDGISVIKVPLQKPPRRRRSSTPRCSSRTAAPRRRRPRSPTPRLHDDRLPRHHRAARRRTSRRAPAWATACCSTSRTRSNPKVIDQVQDNVNFAFWHSATFNHEGTKVVFTDELGGGGAATCNAAIGPNRGADGIYDIVGKGDKRKLVFRSYFKIPRHQADTENCVAHNGSLIPVKGKDIMVQAWYQGGVSVWDFTDSSKPKEIALLRARPAVSTAASRSAARGRRTTTTATSTPTTSPRARRPEAQRPAHGPGQEGQVRRPQHADPGLLP